MKPENFLLQVRALGEDGGGGERKKSIGTKWKIK